MRQLMSLFCVSIVMVLLSATVNAGVRTYSWNNIGSGSLGYQIDDGIVDRGGEGEAWVGFEDATGMKNRQWRCWLNYRVPTPGFFASKRIAIDTVGFDCNIFNDAPNSSWDRFTGVRVCALYTSSDGWLNSGAFDSYSASGKFNLLRYISSYSLFPEPITCAEGTYYPARSSPESKTLYRLIQENMGREIILGMTEQEEFKDDSLWREDTSVMYIGKGQLHVNYGCTPSVSSPQDGATINAGSNLTVSWSDEISGSVRLGYRWRFQRYINGAWQVVDSGFTSSNSKTCGTTASDVGQWKFEVQVRNRDYDTTSTVSGIDSATTAWASVAFSIEDNTIYFVTYDKNGGEGTAPSPQSGKSGTIITLPSKGRLSSYGQSFCGWNTKADGTGTTYDEGASYTITGDVTLYAKWEDNPIYSVYFWGNENTGGTEPATMYGRGGTFIIVPGPNTLFKTGYTFVGWNTRKDGTGDLYPEGEGFCIHGYSSLYATWAVDYTYYTITTSSNPSYGGSTGGGGSKQSGTSCTVTATPASGYSFSNWTEGGTVVSTSSSYTFTVTGARTLTANFTANPVYYTITTSSNPSYGGSTGGGGSKQSGTSCTVTATPASGYSFSNWTEGGTVVSTSSSYTFTVTGARTLTANFTAKYYTLTVSSSNPDSGVAIGSTTGHGGATVYTKTVSAGETINLQAPEFVGSGASRKRFVEWQSNCSVGDPVRDKTFLYDTMCGDENGNMWICAVYEDAHDFSPTITTSSPLPNGYIVPGILEDSEYGETLAASGGTAPYTWSLASGSLPPGLSLSGDGVISGVLTVPGTFYFTIRVTGSGGLSSTKEFSLTVYLLNYDVPCDPLDDAVLTTIGSYDGYLEAYREFRDMGSATVQGTLNVKLSNLDGRLTAKAVLQAGSVSFSGRQWTGRDGDGTRFTTLTARSGERLDLFVRQNRIWGSLAGGKAGAAPLELSGVRNRFADRKDVMAQAILNQYKGYYTATLFGRDFIQGSLSAAPHGDGYLTLTVNTGGKVRIAGVLADGTRVSQSAQLLHFADCGECFCVPFFVPLYRKTGCVSGLFWIDPETRGMWCEDFLWWEKLGAGPDGFTGLLDIRGGPYNNKSPALQTRYMFESELDGDLAAYHAAGEAWGCEFEPMDVPVNVTGSRMIIARGDRPVRIREYGETWYEYGGENPNMVTLNFTARTGIFRGNFTLYYDYYDERDRFQHKTVKVPYVGVMLQQPQTGRLEWGYGHCLFPSKDPELRAYRIKPSFPVWLAGIVIVGP
jgi:hypothetical protein